MLVKCPNCGILVSDKAIKCPKCGIILKQEKTIESDPVINDGGGSKPDPVAPVRNEPEEAPGSSASQSLSKEAWALIITVVFCIILWLIMN